jgi:hypothetical protein
LAKNSNRPWTDEEDRRLLQLRAAGRSVISVAVALRRSAGAVGGRLNVLSKRAREMASVPSGLKPMATFNPSEPAILHDSLTDKIKTWTGEDTEDFCKTAIVRPEGTIEWRQFVFDGWGNVLGG